MLVLGLIVAAIIGLAVWVGPTIFRDIKEKKAIVRAINSLSVEKKAEFFKLIETAGNAPSKGVVGLFIADDLEQVQIAIILSPDVPDYPWTGKLLTVAPAFDRRKWPWPPVKFSISDSVGSVISTRYRLDRYCKIPAFQGSKAKKASSVFSVNRMFQLSPQLRDMAIGIFPANPDRLVAQLLSPDGKSEHRAGYDQVRLGLTAEYLQDYRNHKCLKCKRPLKLVIQVPGSMIHRRLGDGTAYLFGCPSHPEETVTDYDTT